MMNEFNKKYMQVAYEESLKAFKKNEIPVGAVIVKNNKIIAKSYNDRQTKYNVLGHAEINAIIKAEKKIKDWRLDGYTMYVTLKPCLMCLNIIKESRLDKVFYLIEKNVDNYNVDNYEDNNILRINDCNEVANQYQKVLKEFFEKLRK